MQKSWFENGGRIGGNQDLSNSQPYFQEDAQTVLLLDGNGTNGSQNNTYLTTNHASIDMPGGFSVLFDGDGDLVSAPSNAIWTWANKAAWTFEAWIYPKTRATAQPIYAGFTIASSTNNGELYLNTSGNLVFRYWIGSQVLVTSTGTVNLNTWSHVAFVYDGTNIALYINGSRQAFVARQSPADVTTNIFYLGTTWGGHTGSTQIYFTGYISNARVVNGTAVYTGTSFTVPTAPLTAITNTALLTARYSTFSDGSTNNFTITAGGNAAVATPTSPGFTTTRVGNPTQGSFTPYGNIWSNFFNGSNSQLTFNSSGSAINFTGAFTFECWFYLTSNLTYIGSFGNYVGRLINGSGNGAIEIAVGSANNATTIPSSITLTTFGATGGPAGSIGASNLSIPLNQWHHVAVVRDISNAMAIFFNGLRVATATVTGTYASQTVKVGGDGAASNYFGWFPGYISNLRVVKGTDIYGASNTYITVPTESLTAIANTSLLTCQANRFLDASTNNYSVTVVGSPAARRFGPFPYTTDYNASANIGSTSLDGNDRIVTSASPIFAFGASSWTVECWVYFTSVALGQHVVVDYTNPSSAGYSIALYMAQAGTLRYYLSNTGSSWNIATDVLMGNVTTGQWTHIALVRNGNVYTPYINGVAGTQTTNSASLPTTAEFIGVGGDGSTGGTIGFLSDFRYTKSAVYTANFTPPTAPLASIAGTEILMSFTNAGITDKTYTNNLETVGNAQVSTAVRKFGTGSLSFDGTGDYLVSNPSSSDMYAFGTGNFTIEFWLYLNATQTSIIYDGRPASTQGAYPTIYLSSNSIRYYVSSADRITGPTLQNSRWYHIAVCRSGTSTKMFVDGVQAGSTYSDTTSYLGGAGRPIIGGGGDTVNVNIVNGYLDDLRVTRTARYPNNGFIIPNSELVNYSTTRNLKNSGVWSVTNVIGRQLSDYGMVATNPARSAEDLLRTGRTTDGVYWINLPTVGVTRVYCLLDPKWNGGGWMLAMKATRGNTFSYTANYWTTDNTLNPNNVNLDDGDAKYEVMNKFAAKDIMARWPDITNSLGQSSGSISGLTEWTWLENDFNNGVRQTLISFFNAPSGLAYTGPSYGGSGYFVRDAKSFSGWAPGKFSSQTDIRFYGFNYIKNTTLNAGSANPASARWGFGWNENGDGLFPSVLVAAGANGSNDVTGGIGLNAVNLGGQVATISYSAGDYIGCCSDSTGVNRSARVEIYVR